MSKSDNYGRRKAHRGYVIIKTEGKRPTMAPTELDLLARDQMGWRKGQWLATYQLAPDVVNKSVRGYLWGYILPELARELWGSDDQETVRKMYDKMKDLFAMKPKVLRIKEILGQEFGVEYNSEPWFDLTETDQFKAGMKTLWSVPDHEFKHEAYKENEMTLDQFAKFVTDVKRWALVEWQIKLKEAREL